MFRVTKSEVGKRTIITIDGQLSGDYIEVVEICCNQAISEGRPVDVFLHNVLIIDESGRALLARLAGQGVRLLTRDCTHLMLCGTSWQLVPQALHRREPVARQ